MYNQSNFGKAIAAGAFHIPPPAQIPRTNFTVPHVLLGGFAFALTQNMVVLFSHYHRQPI